jgi:cellulose synthase/poly-beta-1,6-N-acetylglucosamine synthase-like glycosyltransferase
MILQIAILIITAHVLLTWVLSIRRGIQARKRDASRSEEFAALPPVSILVPAWREQDTIEWCVRSLQNIDYPDWEAIILAGPESTLDVATQVVNEDRRFRVVERGPEPKNVALNKGIQLAAYDTLVLLDADSIVDPGWLTALIKPIARGAAATYGMHYPIDKSWIAMEEHLEIIQAYYIYQTKLFQGCSSVALTRKAYNLIGSLPADAFAWEDWDIGIRLFKLGERVEFAPQACLLTERPATWREYWANAVRCHRSHLVGIWHHRKVIAKKPVLALSESYLYLFSIAFYLISISFILLGLIFPVYGPSLIFTWMLIMFWILGRRAAITAEVAIYTEDMGWFRYIWAPPLLLLVQVTAAVAAIMSSWKLTPFDYKGPRKLKTSNPSS